MQSNAINTTFVNLIKLHFKKHSEIIDSQFMAKMHYTGTFDII